MSTDGLTLEERVQRLEDLQAISRLFHDYRRYLDGKDFLSYSQLFVEDGEFGADQAPKGPAEIQKYVEGLVPRGFLREQKGEDLHLVANEVVDVDGDRATTYVTWVYIVRQDDGTPVLCKTGHYEDNLVRHDGRWKFARRRGSTQMTQ